MLLKGLSNSRWSLFVLRWFGHFGSLQGALHKALSDLGRDDDIDFITVQGGKLTLIDEDAIIAELQAVHAELKDQIMGSEDSARPVFEGVEKAYRMALQRPVARDMTRALLEDHAQNAKPK